MYKFIVLLAIFAVFSVEARREEHHSVRRAVEHHVARKIALRVLRRAIPMMIMETENTPTMDSELSADDDSAVENLSLRRKIVWHIIRHYVLMELENFPIDDSELTSEDEATESKVSPIWSRVGIRNTA